MSTPVAFLVLFGISVLFCLEVRTLVRELKTGVPHLFFSPHPSYRGRPGNRRGLFLRLSVAGHIFSTLVLALMVIAAVLFVLESLGVIYE